MHSLEPQPTRAEKKGPYLSFEALTEGLGFHYPAHEKLPPSKKLSKKDREENTFLYRSFDKVPISKTSSLPIYTVSENSVINSVLENTKKKTSSNIFIKCFAFFLDTCIHFTIYLGISLTSFWIKIGELQNSEFFLNQSIFIFFLIFCIFHGFLLGLQKWIFKTSMGQYLVRV